MFSFFRRRIRSGSIGGLLPITTAAASPSVVPVSPSGQRNGGTYHDSVLPCVHGLYWGGRVGPIETIFTHVHPPHLCLGHGAMGVPAATMRVTHTLKVVTKAKVAAFIRHGGVHPLVRHHND